MVSQKQTWELLPWDSSIVWGMFTWWKDDLPFDGSEEMGELEAYGTPFGGMKIEKPVSGFS